MKILKMCLASAVLLSTNLQSFAQVEWQAPHRIDYFEQIDYSKNLVYTFNPAKEGKMYILTLFSPKGALLGEIEVEYKTSLKLRSVTEVGTNTVMYFIDANTGVLLSIDKDGKQIARTEFEDKQSFSYETYLQDCDGSSFFLTRNIKNEKMGHITEKFNLQLKSQWDFTVTPEKGRNQVMMCTGSSNGVFLMSKYLKNAFATDGPISLIFLDKDGKVTSNTPLATIPPSFAPYFIKPLSDGSVFIAADYGKPMSTVYPLIPMGLNYMKIKNDGTISVNVFLENKKIQEKIGPKKEDNTPKYLEAPGVRVVDIKEVNGDVNIYTESYFLKVFEVTVPGSTTTVTTTSNNAELVLGDIYIFKMNDMEMASAKRIWKPKKTYQIKDFFRGTLEYISDELKSIHAFTVQGFKGNDIVIRNFNRGFQYVNVIKEGEAYDKVEKRVYFGKSIGNSSGDNNYVPILSDYTGKAGQIYNEGMMMTDQGVLLYQYNHVTNNLEFSFINI